MNYIKDFINIGLPVAALTTFFSGVTYFEGRGYMPGAIVGVALCAIPISIVQFLLARDSYRNNQIIQRFRDVRILPPEPINTSAPAA